MKTNYMTFLKAISNVRLTGPDRSFAIAAAVASSVADYIPVPAAKADSASGEFTRSGAMIARNHVGSFNEVAPFDVRLALELVRKFWMLRYETIHARRLHDTVAGDYFCGYFSVGRNFSEDEINKLNDMAMQICALEVGIREVLQKIKDSQDVENLKAATSNIASATLNSPIIA